MRICKHGYRSLLLKHKLYEEITLISLCTMLIRSETLHSRHPLPRFWRVSCCLCVIWQRHNNCIHHLGYLFDEYKYHDFLQARLKSKLVIEAWLNFVLIQTQRLKFRNVTAKKKNVVVTLKIKFCCYCHFAPVTSVAFVEPFFCHENVNMSFFQ